jgi:bifunctional DNase/RNase
MLPVDVTGVSVCPPYNGYVVILREKEGERWLPIFIGAAEAQAISLLLQEMRYSRPLTFDLFHNLIEAADAEIQQVVVSDLKDNTFYAQIEMRTTKGMVKIDARPSDAIALGLRAKVPLFVAEHVMNSAAITENRTENQISNLDEIARLNRLLENAIIKESYEEAAELRDRIRDLERKENLR